MRVWVNLGAWCFGGGRCAVGVGAGFRPAPWPSSGRAGPCVRRVGRIRWPAVRRRWALQAPGGWCGGVVGGRPPARLAGRRGRWPGRSDRPAGLGLVNVFSDCGEARADPGRVPGIPAAPGGMMPAW